MSAHPVPPSELPNPSLVERAHAWARRLGPGFALEPLQRLLALDPLEQAGLMVRLLGVFEESLRLQSQALEEAIESADFDRICRAAHTVRSSSLSMGAEAFAAACLALEKDAQALKSGSLASAASEPQALLEQARCVCQEARKLRAQVLRAQSPLSAECPGS